MLFIVSIFNDLRLYLVNCLHLRASMHVSGLYFMWIMDNYCSWILTYYAHPLLKFAETKGCSCKAVESSSSTSRGMVPEQTS